jgi:hypothetical protein
MPKEARIMPPIPVMNARIMQMVLNEVELPPGLNAMLHQIR